MGANKNRGEHDLKIDGKTYTLVLLATDVDDLETRLGSMRKLMKEISSGEALESQERAVLTRGFRRVDPRPTPEEVKRLLSLADRNKTHEAAFYLVAGALNQLNEQQEDDEPVDDEKREKGTGENTKDPFSDETGA